MSCTDFRNTNPCLCCFVIFVVVYHGVEDDNYGQGGVVGHEGHPAAELSLVHYVHVASKKHDF